MHCAGGGGLRCGGSRGVGVGVHSATACRLVERGVRLAAQRRIRCGLARARACAQPLAHAHARTRTRTHKHKRAHTHMHKHRHTRGDGTEKLSARACCVQQCHAHTQAGYPRKRRRRRGAIQSRAQQRHARRGGRSGAACCLLHVVCCMSSVACRLLHVVCRMSSVACRLLHVVCRMSSVAAARTMSRPIRCWFKNRDGWLTEAEPSCLRGFSSRITSRRARPARSAGCTEDMAKSETARKLLRG